jgi:hypothetical protein
MALTTLEQLAMRAAAALLAALNLDAVDPLHDGGRVHRNFALGSPVGSSSPQQFVNLTQGFSMTAGTYEELYLAIADLSDTLGRATLAVAGTFTKPDAEADVKVGGLTITLTLTRGTWTTDVASDTTKAKALLQRFHSLQDEALGWNQLIVPAMLAQVDGTVAAATAPVVRTSNTVVTVTTPLEAEQNAFTGDATDYLITADETVEFLCPTWAVMQGPSSEEAAGIPASVNGAAAVDSRVVTNA